MVKKQRRKKLTTPSKTEGSAGQAEGEALVGSCTPTLDPHPRLQIPGLGPAGEGKVPELSA